jgi:hypothetical protein
MLHDGDVIAGRLSLYAKATTPEEQAVALRKLFEASACPHVDEIGSGRDRSIECVLPGAGDETIVVGVGQKYDSPGSPALLSSLQEALAAAPRRHTFRFVAFSTHESKDEDRTTLKQTPKGAKRLVDALSDHERALVQTMVHLGPIGFGPVWTHPPGVDERLECAFESALRISGAPRGAADHLVRECSGAGSGSFLGCEESARWAGGNDWQPFRRAGIPVFGIHSGGERRVGGRLQGDLYFSTYRMLAIFLALADEALAPGGGAPAPAP